MKYEERSLRGDEELKVKNEKREGQCGLNEVNLPGV